MIATNRNYAPARGRSQEPEMMQRTAFWLTSAALLAAFGLTPALAPAADDPYTTVRLELGTPDGKMAFVPAHLELRVGTRYRLNLVNVGPVDHEFDAPQFTLNAESERVEVFDKAGTRVAVLQGKPDEIVVAPGARVEWYLMPIKPLASAEMLCDLPGHREAGMKGTLRVR
jgi:uncharacterized cupredoxin-like copper-binding protein